MSSSASGGRYDPNAVDRAVQTRLNDIVGAASPVLKNQPIGFLLALTSQRNTNSIQFMTDTQDGTLNEGTGDSKKVFYRYYQPKAESSIQIGEAANCDVETDTKPCIDSDEITNPVIRTEVASISKRELRRIDETFEGQMAREVSLVLPALRRKINRVLATEAAGKAGQLLDSAGAAQASLSFNIINSTEGSVRPFGLAQIDQAMLDNGIEQTPFYVGSGNWKVLDRFNRISAVSGSTVQDTGLATGVDGLTPYDYHYDNMLPGIIASGTNKILGWEPGALQLLNFVYNRGVYREVRGDDWAETTIMDPMTGLMFDLYWKYEFCTVNGVKGSFLKWWMETYVQTWSMPSDIWQSGHDLETTNGIFIIEGAAV